jgi:phosphoribosyl 1,2-cyclic phosphodiesterase
MKVTLWGTRGSLATPGPEMARYGGNTSCVSVLGLGGTMLVLDAGTGIRRLGTTIPDGVRRIDILLTHLHMDHIQGLGFFAPLYRPDLDVHIWGPGSATLRLQARLRRYLSPPLFPVSISELPCRLSFHEVPGDAEIGEFRVCSALVCHPGPTVGYRIQAPEGGILTYLPDHEPALAMRRFPSLAREWTSGGALAASADLLIHDGQYGTAEYPGHLGWGHSTLTQAMNFGTLTGVRRLVPFHHDPSHTDAELDRLLGEALDEARPAYEVTPGCEGTVFEC